MTGPGPQGAPDAAPILVQDSGLGGLTVLRALRAALPSARFVYLADDAAFPYGDWAEAALERHLLSLFERALARHCPRGVVIACNTASTIALEALRARFPQTPFIGTVPAIKPAAERTRSGLISVLATPGTVARVYTHRLVATFAEGCDVRLVGSARLAALAERHMAGDALDEAAVRAEIAPCFVETSRGRTDTIVLACTHYPLLIDALTRLAPWPVAWIDPAEAIARRATDVLGRAPFVPTAPPDGQAIFTSGRQDAASARLLTAFGLAAG